MAGEQEVAALFARMFAENRLRLAMLRAGSDEARREVVQAEGFPCHFTLDDVRAQARILLETGQRPTVAPQQQAPAWNPAPGQTWADAPFSVKQTRRASLTFGRMVGGVCRPSAPAPAPPPPVRVSYMIVGTVKGGTSALDHFLSQHPDICTARQKETHFFCNNLFFEGGVPRYDWYALSFDHCDGAAMVGEATPDYMYASDIGERLHGYNPGMKLICLLRNPVDRAYSDYLMRVGRGEEERSFTQAVGEEVAFLEQPDEGDGPPQADYLGSGFYMAAIRELLRSFPREQLLLLRSEKLRSEHHRTLEEVHAFLDVRPGHVPEPKSVLAGSGRRMDETDRGVLVDLYREEVGELEQFTGWDLSGWRR